MGFVAGRARQGQLIQRHDAVVSLQTRPMPRAGGTACGVAGASVAEGRYPMDNG